MKARLWMGALSVALVVFQMGTAQAQTGVSDDRVSLPEGPGSLEGIGENVSLSPNMGTMGYGINIKVPSGFAGVTPSVRLAYSSGAGSSVVGVGWSMPVPNIERSTFKGLPEYNRQDTFTADGGSQLVEVPGQAVPTYRARYEGGFVRYTWHEAGDGREGFWRAEYPDGRVATFGARADGTLVPEARVSGDEGTFRYMMVEMVDVYGHSMRYTYEKFGAVALVRQIGYVYTNGPDQPRYSLSFQYEERRDEGGFDFLSDAKPGFDERLEQRLTAVNVFSGDERIRRYEVSYEPYAESGGFTRLSQVEVFGLEGGLYPAVQKFNYSRTLEGVCDEGDDCEQPFVIDMGNIGVNIGVGKATMVDINGDALPDIIDTTDDGAHRFVLNIADSNSRPRFSEQTVESAIGTGSGFRLGTPFVQVLDVNGDGFADLLNSGTGRALINRGAGDWVDAVELSDTGDVSDALGADFDLGEGGLRNLRFIDLNNDKRIDLMRSTRQTTSMWLNMGPEGFVEDESGELLEYDLQVDDIQMTDMNGDGLLDAVRLSVGGLRYKLNLGRGKWGDEIEVVGLPIEESELDLATLDDLNGDGLSDLVIVVGRQVKFAINRNGTTFSQITTLNSGNVSGDLPLRDGTVTVIMADVNGNGSIDVVWLDSQGQVTALELFPVRPNQLSRVENSLGKRTDIFYSTSVQQMARDPQPWAYTLPHPMLVVERVERTDLLTNIVETTEYRYRDGFYDGDEKQFRGYAMVEILSEGDETQEEGLQIDTYDVGAEDTYRKGLMLGMRMLSAGRVLNEKTYTYEDCPVAETGTTEPAIRYICNTESTTVLQEGVDESEHVTLRQRSVYDGYGNITLNETLGVVAVGGGACEPCGDRAAGEFDGACGAECKGDEFFVETNFVQPGEDTNGRWILGAPFRVSRYGDPDSELKTETLYYYDGAPFEGLSLGSLDQGNISRTTVKREVGSDDVITVGRFRYDGHGNIIETLDAQATPDAHAHRSIVTFDEDQLRIIQQDLLLEDPSGQPYRLRREVQYEPVFDKVVESTAWMRADAQGQTLDSRRSTTYTYDEFGRPTSTIRPGDDVGAPTDTYTYDLGNPTSRIISRTRSESGGELDIETIQCLDGRGRVFQKRKRLESGLYQVSGFSLFNLNSKPFRIYQPYTSPSAECDQEPPGDVLFVDFKRDAMGRLLRTTVPDADIYGEASFATVDYVPLGTISTDQEDNDPSSPHAGTPSTTRVDGLGRVLVSQRVLADGTVGGISAVYDGLGHIIQAIDAEGNVKRQSYDLLGRVLRVDDPNKANATTFQYNDVGLVTAIEDGRGAIVRSKYDGANRIVEQWDDADREGTLISWLWDHDPNCDPALCTNTASVPVRTESPNLAQDGRNTTLFGYDARGRSVSTQQILEGVTMTFEVAYDNASRPILATFPNGRTLSYSYDDADRLTGIEGIFSDVEYDRRGQMRSVRYGDGSTVTNEFDSLLRLSSHEITQASGEVLQGFAFTRDRTGNILGIEDLATTAGPNHSAAFTYDAWYRNTSAQLALASPDNEEIIDSAFSPNGKVLNRTSSLASTALQTGDYRYDSAAPNALTRAGVMEMTYDAAGYTTDRGAERFDWDAQGRLRSVTNQTTGDVSARFAYGTDHTRVVKVEGDSTTLYPHPSFELRDGISTLYVKLGNSRMARIQDDALATTALSDIAPLNAQASEIQPDGQINAADAWLAVALRDGLLDVAAEEEPSSAGALLQSSLRRMFMERDAEVTFLYHDHLGSITMATRGDTGEVEGKRAFYPTGAERESFGYVDEYGFTGQEIDRSTGLLHFKHRYFDPTTGHWLSADPLFAITGLGDLTISGEALNAYGYVGHNYPNSVDPDGLLGPGGGGNAGNAGGGGGGNTRGPSMVTKAKQGLKKACDTCKQGAKNLKTGIYNKSGQAKNALKKLPGRTYNKVKNGTSRNLDELSDGELQDIVDNVDQRIERIQNRPNWNKRMKQVELVARIAFEGTEVGIALTEAAAGSMTGVLLVAGMAGAAAGLAVMAHDVYQLKKISNADPSTEEGRETINNNLPLITKGVVALLKDRQTRAQNILDTRNAAANNAANP